MTEPKRPKRPRDINQLAYALVQESTKGAEEGASFDSMEREKNPAAVALGKLGGSKGGKARADNLTPERRKEIAKKAALARWKPNQK